MPKPKPIPKQTPTIVRAALPNLVWTLPLSDLILASIAVGAVEVARTMMMMMMTMMIVTVLAMPMIMAEVVPLPARIMRPNRGYHWRKR